MFQATISKARTKYKRTFSPVSERNIPLAPMPVEVIVADLAAVVAPTGADPLTALPLAAVPPGGGTPY